MSDINQENDNEYGYFSEDPNDPLVCICLGCGSQIPDRIAEKDIFLAAGKKGVHKGCGGPTMICSASQAERVKKARQNGQIVP